MRARCGRIISPLVEKTRSTEAEVAGAQKTRRNSGFKASAAFSQRLHAVKASRPRPQGQGQGHNRKAKAKVTTLKAKAKADILWPQAKAKAKA